MAGREVNFDIVARDKASDTLDDVADAAAKVEKLDPTVTVDADTSEARHTLDGMGDQLDKLTDADKIVVLSLRAGAAKTELADLATDLATIDQSSPDVDVKFDRFAEVSGQLDELEQQMRDIAGTSIDPDVQGKAKARLADVGAEAGKASDAVHSMAGNAIGDFAATTTGIGPLGEAVGQLTEGIANAEVSFSQLATAGLSMGGLAAAMWEIQQAMAKMKARDAFDKAQVDAFTASLKLGVSEADALRDALSAAGKIQAPNVASWANPFADAVSDVTDSIAAAGLTLDQFNALVVDYKNNAGASGSLTREWGAAQRAAGTDGDVLLDVMNAVAAAAGQLTEAEKAQAASSAVFGDSAKQVELFGKATDQLKANMWKARDATDDLTSSIGDAVRKTDALKASYQKLSDQITNDQAYLDLADQIDAVTDAGTTAIAEQAEADKARAQGAADAAAQQREAEAAMRDYQTAVNQTKLDIINLAATAGASPVELQTALDKVDRGDLEGAKADAEAWSRRNPIKLTGTIGQILGAGLGKAAGTSTTINVTQNLPRGWHGDALDEAQRAARRSGGLFQRARR